MPEPRRIQRKRAKGSHTPQGAVYVGRPTLFGNPYRLVRQGTGWSVQFGDHGGGVGTFHNTYEARRYATEAFRVWINQPEQEPLRALARQLLYGHSLTCWCPLPEPGEPDHCHAAVLLALAAEHPPAPGSTTGQARP